MAQKKTTSMIQDRGARNADRMDSLTEWDDGNEVVERLQKHKDRIASLHGQENDVLASQRPQRNKGNRVAERK